MPSQETPAELVARPDGHVHGRERSAAARNGARAVGGGEEAALGGGQEREAGLGEAHAARRPLEERRSELLLELLDALTERRRREGDRSRSSPEIEELRGRGEAAQGLDRRQHGAS